MRKTGNKWKTDCCGRCGKSHSGYSGKLDSKGIEYVVCEITNKRMDVSLTDLSYLFPTLWQLDDETCQKESHDCIS